MDLRARMRSSGDVAPLFRIGPGQYYWERYCDGWARLEALWTPEIVDFWAQSARDQIRISENYILASVSLAALVLATGEVDLATRDMSTIYCHEETFRKFDIRVRASKKRGRIRDILREMKSMRGEEYRGSRLTVPVEDARVLRLPVEDARVLRFDALLARDKIGACGDLIGRTALNIIFLWASEALERMEDWGAVRDLRAFHASAVDVLGPDPVYKNYLCRERWDAAAPTLLTWADWFEEKAMKAQADGMRTVVHTHAGNAALGMEAAGSMARAGPSGFSDPEFDIEEHGSCRLP